MRVLVLGGGIAGVTAAYFMARDGHEVTVVEAQDALGLDATAANAGIIAPGHSFAWASPRAPRMLWRSLLGQETAIRLRLKRFAALLKDPEAVAAYKVHEPDILDATRMHLVRHMLSPAKLAAANVNNLAYSFRQLFDASRLLRGESTSNVGLHVSLISDAVKERAKSTIAVDVEVPAAYDPTI